MVGTQEHRERAPYGVLIGLVYDVMTILADKVEAYSTSLPFPVHPAILIGWPFLTGFWTCR